MQGLCVLMLGQGRIELDGQSLTRLLAPKQQAIVFYLAATGAPVARNKLAELFWGEQDESSSRANLRTALSRMRRWLPEQLLIDAVQVGFAPNVPVQVDLQALTRALAADTPLAERLAAAQAWRGPVLDGFEIVAAEGFEAWLSPLRRRAQADMQALRHDLLRRSETAGLLDEAMAHARALLDIDDADEVAHMALMRALAATGRRTAAIAQYEACRAALVEHLGARPSADCYALYTHIHADAPAPGIEVLIGPTGNPNAATAVPKEQQEEMPADPTSITHRPAHPHGSLIGRATEWALLLDRLGDPGCSWLTVTGPGGVGKTRLVKTAATELAAQFRHGVLWLSGRDDAGGALRNAESLAQAVVARTGADRQNPGALLLVLDNLETVSTARRFEPVLRHRAPGVQVLASSRTRVGGAHEWLLELQGLSLEIEMQSDAPSPLSPAAQLFASAVRRLVPAFDPAAQAASVDQLCRAVGGLPLALEMAARNVHTAGLGPVLVRLQNGTALTDDDRDTHDRHRSLQAVLQDSWVLLDASTQNAALRLAQLPGEFDLALAQAAGIGQQELDMLRAHSWLTPATDMGGRLAFHPLQQTWLRQQPAAATLGPMVLSELVQWLDLRLPAVEPFADLPFDTTDATQQALHLAAEACGAPPLLAAAAQRCCDSETPQKLVGWIDRLVALLQRADRQAEAAQVLTLAMARRDLPTWQLVGWGLRRAEMLQGHGASTAALRSYVHAFAALGLWNADLEQAPWSGLPASVRHARRLLDWPANEPQRSNFSTLVVRSLYCAIEHLAFSPDPQPLQRVALVTDLLSRRLGREAGLRSFLTAWGALSAGHASVGRWLHRIADRHHQRWPINDPASWALIEESRCVQRAGLGDWAGLTPQIENVARLFARLGWRRHEKSMVALAAKLAFYQGRLSDAQRRYEVLNEMSLSQPGESWRAWAPIGLAEVGLSLDTLDDAALQRHYDAAALVMTEMENVDAAYTLRRLGLAARLAWRSGDAEAATAAVQAGAMAASRMQAGWWSHEGYAGLGDTLLALYVHEQRGGGVLGPIESAWKTFEPALAGHVRRFPPAMALHQRLLGARALLQGRGAEARSRLKQALVHAEKSGMRVELVRTCHAMAEAEPDGDWTARTQRLWHDMRSGTTQEATQASPLARG